jgi:hypothetical protein
MKIWKPYIKITGLKPKLNLLSLPQLKLKFSVCCRSHSEAIDVGERDFSVYFCLIGWAMLGFFFFFFFYLNAKVQVTSNVIDLTFDGSISCCNNIFIYFLKF